jgi:hypothetical protein
MNAPIITMFIRHPADCKHKREEFCRRRQCKKHLRWTLSGTQYRKAANTRLWAEAERVKRDLDDQFSGRPVAVEAVGAAIVNGITEEHISLKRNEAKPQWKRIDSFTLQPAKKLCAASYQTRQGFGATIGAVFLQLKLLANSGRSVSTVFVRYSSGACGSAWA